MFSAKAKRFYAETGWETAAGGFQVTLDGKPLNTPGDKPLIVPSARLAAAVAGEWAVQDETLDPAAMPLTGLVCTAIDRIGAGREAVADHIARYGETDLLCYRAAEPAALAERQHDAWQPLLDWAAETIGAGFAVTTGIRPVAQPAATLKALRAAIDALDDFGLAALAAATQASGSVVIGLAVVQGRIGPDEAADAAHLDDRWQKEKWGEDENDRERRRRITAEIAAAARLLDLIRAESSG